MTFALSADRTIGASTDNLLVPTLRWIREAGAEDCPVKGGYKLARGLACLARAIDRHNAAQPRESNIALAGALIEECRRCYWLPDHAFFDLHDDVFDPLASGGGVPIWGSLKTLALVAQLDEQFCLWRTKTQSDRIKRDRDGRGRGAA